MKTTVGFLRVLTFTALLAGCRGEAQDGALTEQEMQYIPTELRTTDLAEQLQTDSTKRMIIDLKKRAREEYDRNASDPVLAPFYDFLKQNRFDEAYRYIQPLAREGNSQAQVELGTLYFLGKGVAKDNKVGVEWCQKAADQGNGQAMSILASMYSNDQFGMKDLQKARALGERCAKQWRHTCIVRNALSYLDNSMNTQDWPRAYAWAQIGTEAGIESSRQVLESMQPEYTDHDKAEVERIKAEILAGMENP